MSSAQFDIIVIGAGPGGIEAALLASKNGKKTALITATKIGGRAIWGSLIPSKVWLATAENAISISKASDFGLNTSQEITLDMDGLRSRIKDQSSSASSRYEDQLKKANVTIYYGTAKLLKRKQVKIQQADLPETLISSDKIIISSGSGPLFFPNIKPNKDRIIAPKIAPLLTEVPTSILIAGGGVTGTEFAFAFAALGSQVTIIQGQSQLLPRLDKEVCQAFESHLKKQLGIKILTNTLVESMEQIDNKVVTKTQAGEKITTAYGFISIGRKADLSFLDEDYKLALSSENMVVTDEFCQTSEEGIYAIGDVTGVPMTANRAMMQARIAVSHIMSGAESTQRWSHIIEAVYSEPPVASIGNMNSESHTIIITKPISELVKPNIWGETAGFIKIKVDTRSGLIKGAAGFGKLMPEIMSLIQVAMNNNLTYKDIQKTPMAHPTFSELISEVRF